ncbi:hypothetical protein Glove_724g14 [Diversispora epigaea]|uniref:Uncharacterized protein n=1 Tax=Diversispora epigaea TaxID=1348612 RepID=A0A397G093_9GLOM|nr:hypothetical protein Glove_724g14 [Diversispora epigaea]
MLNPMRHLLCMKFCTNPKEALQNGKRHTNNNRAILLIYSDERKVWPLLRSSINFRSYYTTQGKSKTNITPRRETGNVEGTSANTNQNAFADNEQEEYQELALNCLYFYESFDKGLFNEHKKDWILVYKQEVVDLDQKMPNFISPSIHYFEKKLLILKFRQRDVDGDEYMISSKDARWHSLKIIASGYGAPAKLNLAKDPFEMSIGDDNNWRNWVQINTIRVWEAFHGDQYRHEKSFRRPTTRCKYHITSFIKTSEMHIMTCRKLTSYAI